MLFSIKPLFVLAAVNYVVLAQLALPGSGECCFCECADETCSPANGISNEVDCICNVAAHPDENLQIVECLVARCLPAGSRNPVAAEQLISEECAARTFSSPFTIPPPSSLK
ncbi:hypothetical protein BD410DRAFT_167874 [Rickenella mellea]|uniref:Extracellular membrane protein CFEM domain-containing protein n=1 Tax=Rickenella mellea TaxID=50990 RepID=A0A4Y7PI28_9AGAM|nr:hypothetical protein BD410DRAFT_167874 [Rickenella mellea]